MDWERTIQVSNFSPKLTEQMLRQFFSYCGTIVSLSYAVYEKYKFFNYFFISDPISASPKYLVEFASPAEASTATLLDGTKLMEVPIKITPPKNFTPVSSKNSTGGDAARMYFFLIIRQQSF